MRGMLRLQIEMHDDSCSGHLAKAWLLQDAARSAQHAHPGRHRLRWPSIKLDPIFKRLAAGMWLPPAIWTAMLPSLTQSKVSILAAGKWLPPTT